MFSRLLSFTKVLLKWLLIIAFSLLGLILLFVEGFDRYLGTEKGIQWMFSEVQTEQFEIHYTEKGLRYLSLGESQKPALLMVHGAPGSVLDWLNFSSQERIFQHYRLLLVDRPGYGGTQMRKPEPSIIENAALLLDIIQSEPDSSVTVLGHSYGAPIAMILGALDSVKIKRIIASSGQYDPENEIIFNISHMIKYPIFKYMMPYMFWVSNEEKMAHPKACREALPYYSRVKAKVDLIHGNADGLVLYENASFIQALLTTKNQLIPLKGFGHFLPGVAVDFLVDFTISDQAKPPVRNN